MHGEVWVVMRENGAFPLDVSITDSRETDTSKRCREDYTTHARDNTNGLIAAPLNRAFTITNKFPFQISFRNEKNKSIS